MGVLEQGGECELEKVESTWRESIGSGVHRPNRKSNLIGQEAGVPCVGCWLVEKNTCTWLALLLFSDVLAGNHKYLAPLNNKVKKTNHKQLIEDDTQACDHYLIPQARFRQEVCAYHFQLRTGGRVSESDCNQLSGLFC